MGRPKGSRNRAKPTNEIPSGPDAPLVDLTGDEAQSFAAQGLSQRTTQKTKKIYAGKLNKWTAYFSSKYADIVQEG